MTLPKIKRCEDVYTIKRKGTIYIFDTMCEATKFLETEKINIVLDKKAKKFETDKQIVKSFFETYTRLTQHRKNKLHLKDLLIKINDLQSDSDNKITSQQLTKILNYYQVPIKIFGNKQRRYIEKIKLYKV